MPISLGTRSASPSAGGVDTVSFRITNDDLRTRTFHTAATGKARAFVDFEPAMLTLGAKERGLISARFHVPTATDTATELEAIVWIRGCHDRYLRWVVKVLAPSGCRSRETSCCCSCELEIADRPDYLHHWYDHFYCNRPCHHREQQ